MPEERPNEGVWEMSKHEFHGELLNALASNNYSETALICANALRHRVSHGLGSGAQTFAALWDLSEGGGRDANQLLLTDRIVALAEAFGILPIENPEQGRYSENIYQNVFDLIEKIETIVGFCIGRPRVMGSYGIPLRQSEVIDFRVPDDVYCTWRIKKILELSGKGKIVEIGGGFGGMALFANRAGFMPYTIVDLPVINVLQGYYAIKCLGGDAVQLYGEVGAERQINILPWWCFYDESYKFDITFNRDSLAEIQLNLANDYIDEVMRRKMLFLSINQEAKGLAGRVDLHQISVHEICNQRKNMDLLSRHKYWIRRGYTEELYLGGGAL